MSSSTVMPPPPRRTGDDKTDLQQLYDWAEQIFRALVTQSQLGDPSYQATAGTFDPDNLPDPAATSIAKAQQTANEAYALAASLVP